MVAANGQSEITYLLVVLSLTRQGFVYSTPNPTTLGGSHLIADSECYVVLYISRTINIFKL